MIEILGQLLGSQKKGKIFQIKRRPDGTRYVTRKPIRNKLLKEREQQLNKVKIFVHDY